MSAVIFDLDGTIANLDHRKHFVENGNKDWKSFLSKCSDDTLNVWCLHLMNALDAKGLHILIVSGRSEEYMAQTVVWLDDYKIPYDKLFMRKAGDYRKDCEIKKDIYERHIEFKYKILFCVDDRQQVVDFWRSIGLVCLQCAPGDF